MLEELNAALATVEENFGGMLIITHLEEQIRLKTKSLYEASNKKKTSSDYDLF